MPNRLKKTDPAVYTILKHEEERQQTTLAMIPSENFFSPSVREAVGSSFMHKYAEGNIGRRYYEGNQNVDELETLAIDRARKLFKLPKNWGVNVQALSGSNANLAVYLAVLKLGNTIMGMYLPDGGHLSHGWSYEPKQPADPKKVVYLGGSRRVNISSKIFKTVQYKTDPKTQQFNYTTLEAIAVKHRPHLIITGGTAYPRDIAYQRVKKIAQKVGALYLADIAHEAGLVAAGAIPSPVGIADIVTMTTHKTLRAGRGAIILARQELIEKINRAILPGLQGGPFNNNIAGIAVGLGEALQPAFRTYAKNVIRNAQALSKALARYDFKLVSGGGDKHLLLIDLTNKPILGRKFARALAYAGIVTNFNTMPQDQRSPADPSALRLGTPWLTTRGMGAAEMKQIAVWINEVMEIATPWAELTFEEFEQYAKRSRDIQKIARDVKTLCKHFPLNFS